MKTINISLHEFASEQDVEAARASAAAAGENGAQVIRDGKGRPVAVIINFPDHVSNAGLENAKANINSNNGVSKVSLFPIEGTENFTSYPANDTPLTTLQIGSLITGPLTIFNPSDSMQILRSADGAGAGGSGRALEFKDDSTGSGTTHRMQSIWNSPASNLGASTYNTWNGSFKLKLGTNGDVPDTNSLIEYTFGISSGGVGSVRLTSDPATFANSDWRLNAFDGSGIIDTGISPTADYVTVDYSLDILGNLTVDINTVNKVTSVVLPSSSNSFKYGFIKIDKYSAGGTKTQPSCFLDDVTINITSGT